MTKTQIKTDKAQDRKSTLPQNPSAALRELIRLTKALRDMAEQETQALITNNMLPFAYLQMDKESLVAKYQDAAEEFRRRLEEFRGADPALLKQLETLQNELKEKSSANNEMVDRIRSRSMASTMESLFMAQELGQRVEWPEKKTPADQQNDTQHNEEGARR
ncbi:MAG: flagellar export chaperone FlgN [Alphaproteobacteria bacterium]|nr:flagellar export chaperone FlgN [Alphaproteobacteria bacterium]MCB9974101.1 flagellar export chaperone FlgN [Rhodospirillales bacterium]